MSSDRVTLEVTERAADQLGSRRVRRLRKEGMVPGVLYGNGHARAIVVAERELRAALTGRSGLHAIVDVVIEGQTTPHHAVLKEYQRHPIRGTVTHVDFHEVRLDRPIQATVSVQLVGESPGAKQGGVVQQVTREVRVEAGLRLSPRYSLVGRYSYEHTRLFDERFTDEEKPLIDRLFPQVRLSKFSGSFIRDTRNDVIDPDGGTFVILDSELAPRAIGSEVGFVRTFLQGFAFYRVPAPRRTVLAFGARVGAAHGFRRTVVREDQNGAPVTGPDGSPIVDVVQDLPASERFFAGGDTTVRGFSLDRLGTDATISPTGFPTGGNGLVVLNGELRATLIGSVGAVAFIDAGNVFLRATDLDLGELRAAAGFGIRYQSPVGPIRVDLGFKLDRRELSPGRLERRSVLHISLGQAF